MKAILLIFEENEFERMKEAKKRTKSKTWKKMILSLI